MEVGIVRKSKKLSPAEQAARFIEWRREVVAKRSLKKAKRAARVVARNEQVEKRSAKAKG